MPDKITKQMPNKYSMQAEINMLPGFTLILFRNGTFQYL